MRKYKRLLLGLIPAASLCLSEASAMPVPDPAAGEVTDSITGVQYFRRSVSTIKNIAPDLRKLARSVDSLYLTKQIDSLLVSGNASPDGPDTLNRRLALDRARSVYNYIDFATSMPDSLIRVTSRACSWADLDHLLASRSWDSPRMVSSARRIIGTGGPTMVDDLRACDNGALWRWLEAEAFPLMRATSVIAFYETDPINLTPEIPMFDIEGPESVCEVVENVTSDEETSEGVSEDAWRRYVYVKTNLPAWLCLWTNAALEFDLAPHFSATLPIYYSGFNYFKRTLKFRTFAIQPEFRYWPRRDNHGFFVGAHFGMAYYNVALNGDYRYQDRGGHTPALGGGVAVGWRFQLNSDPNLSMEATVGGGVYNLDYDIFENRTNGLRTGGKKRTFYGVDQAALSITYRFGLGKKQSVQSVKEGGEL